MVTHNRTHLQHTYTRGGLQKQGIVVFLPEKKFFVFFLDSWICLSGSNEDKPMYFLGINTIAKYALYVNIQSCFKLSKIPPKL